MPEEKKYRRVGELVQHGENYLKIARAAGRLVFNDEDRFVAALFAGTSIGESGPREDDIDSVDIYTECANLIREISRGIARKHDLSRVFRDIEEHWLWRASDGKLRIGRDSWAELWSNFADGASVIGIDDLAGEYDCPEPQYRNASWVLPYPNLRIGWGEAQPYHRAPDGGRSRKTQKLTASRWITDAGGGRRLDVIRNDAGEPVYVPVRLIAEVRLSLLPIGAGGSFEPVFITRLWTHASLHDKQLRKLCVAKNPDDDELPAAVAWPWLPSDWLETDYLVDRWGLHLEPQADHQQYEIDCAALIGKEPALITQIAWDGCSDQRGGLRIDLVSATSCGAVLGLFDCDTNCVSGDERIVPQLVDPEEAPPEDRDDYICLSKEQTLARAVEVSLFFASPDRRLDALLDRECGRVAADVGSFLKPFKTARQRTRGEILHQWQNGNPR